MFENIVKFFRGFMKDRKTDSKDTAKERLHLVLMQDRANVSADFLELMKQEIIDVIKKYIDVDESSIDVKLTNKTNGDGTTGAPILYANIPIVSIKDENKNKVINENKQKEVVEEIKEENTLEQQANKEENANSEQQTNKEDKETSEKEESIIESKEGTIKEEDKDTQNIENNTQAEEASDAIKEEDTEN